ncbi:MAG TPA: mechanosensitive ion channel domain-containing protein [Mucilaginibacter sp.]|jgi:small-conductance mechanosensitive channel
MRNLVKAITLIVFLFFSSHSGFAQTQTEKKPTLKKRDQQRHAMHKRDSLLKSITKSDTSIGNLLQRLEQYTTTYNQINNTLAEGLDTTDISEQLPAVMRRIDKVIALGNTHKSSTLRYLFVLRDNLDRMQDRLDGWQSDLADINTKLVQNQNDLFKFSKDSLLRTIPSDSVVRVTFFSHLRVVRKLWHKVDSANRSALVKVNLLQDKTSVSYTKILDETDHLDAKIKGFAVKAFNGESDYIWNTDNQYGSFDTVLNSTIKLNQTLFNYFLKNRMDVHLIVALFAILVFGWIIYNRIKAKQINDVADSVFSQANYIYKKPIISALLIVTSISPYFYSHPPAVFLEIFFLISIILTLILIRRDFLGATFNFLMVLFVLTIVYSMSNLFIQLSDVDRYVTFVLSVISTIAGFAFYKKVKKSPDTHLPNTGLALKVFVGLQVLSMLLNITGRFSLAKILGITAIFNLWFLIILYLVIDIIIEGLYLQFEIKKGGNSFINWIDYEVVQKKFRSTLILMASLLWLFFLLQNLSIDDWAVDTVGDMLNQSQSIAGASFTFGGFVIFIFVIWLSSVISKIISYFYDVSAKRVSDLSVLKKKNRTSTLLIRMGVFSIGFLLAVAASGFPLEKLTIIISAFGVGIGFGLQNIVNNLVSGLILAFEKPINIGDVIDVDGVSGTMKEIGIRSSKIATGDGSEVIIPNGDLISHHVTNWTLSNTNRQISLVVNTAYGIDIDGVKEILKNILAGHKDIMTSPGPSVFINNVSASSVEYKVFFWAADIGKVSVIKSGVLADIHNELKKQKVEMPSGQKDYYLHFPDGGPVLSVDAKTKTVEKGKANKSATENQPDPDQ